MAIGWLTGISDADDYFEQERLRADCWDDLPHVSGDGTTQALLLMAYNRLFYHPELNLPSSAAATVAQKVFLRKAQCEMAYYICGHLEDEDRRKGIQAQGVIVAGIAKETYDREWLDKVPIPPFVWGILKKAGFTDEAQLLAADLERDEAYSVDSEIDEHDDLL